VAAEVGVPVRFNDVVGPDAFDMTPGGSFPDAIVHLYGVQPPLALTGAEYAVPVVPLARAVVVIAILPKHRVPSRTKRRGNRHNFMTLGCRSYGDPGQSRRFLDYRLSLANCNEIANIRQKHRGFHAADWSSTAMAYRHEETRCNTGNPSGHRKRGQLASRQRPAVWSGGEARSTCEQQPVYENRRRVRGEYGKSLLRRRGELIERSFAHCYETGGMRRCLLRGRENILKRQLVHVGAFNLSLILRKLLGAGTPRDLKNRAGRIFSRLFGFLCRTTVASFIGRRTRPTCLRMVSGAAHLVSCVFRGSATCC